MNSTSLYRVQREHNFLLSDLETMEGELTEQLEAALAVNEQQFEEAAVSVANVTRSLDSTLAEIELEIKRLTSLKSSVQGRKTFIEGQVKAAMLQRGIQSISTPLLKLSFRKSEAVEIDNEDSVPRHLAIHKPESWVPNKVAIKEAIKAGEQVPGARIAERHNLQIK